jgi:hypothetical protein
MRDHTEEHHRSEHDHRGHDHHAHHSAPEVTAPILVTINPEARVTAEATAAPVPRAAVGEWVETPVAILNEGFVTGDLTIEATPPAGLELDLPSTLLTGEHLQFAAFRYRLVGSNPVDVSLRFWALGALGGLADKNTLSLLLRAA